MPMPPPLGVRGSLGDCCALLKQKNGLLCKLNVGEKKFCICVVCDAPVRMVTLASPVEAAMQGPQTGKRTISPEGFCTNVPGRVLQTMQ